MMLDTVLKTWSLWSGRDDLSDAFKRVLGSTAESEADAAELLAVAKRIDIDDEESWYRELTRLADSSDGLAEASIARGCTDTASREWRRAIDCYEAAAVSFDSSDPRQQAVVSRMQACARAFLRHRDLLGEVVTIPWCADYPLEGYFLPARAVDRAPTVICIVEPGRRKEGCLFKLASHAAERGLSLLVVDLFGPGTNAERFEDIAGSRQLETVIGSVMDYVATRDDVDGSKVAILADEWSSSFVARGIGQDQRCAAAVCDAGLWDIHERDFLAHRVASGRPGMPSTVGASRLARRIWCPVLVAMPARGWLRAQRVAKLVAEMNRDGQDITLKLYPGEQGRHQGSALGDQFSFDWILARLGTAPQRPGKTTELESLRR